MFYDCLRCGYATHYNKDTTPNFKCICRGMTDDQAKYLKGLHAQHYVTLIELRNLQRTKVIVA